MRYILIALFTTSLFSQPLWYHKIQNTKSNTYIGYGSGSSEAKAKQSALVDISSQIYTKIDNSLVQTKKMIDGKYEKDTIKTSSQKTKANFSDYKLVKMSFDDGKYFVAIEYENIPNIQKFKNKLISNGYKLKFDNYFKTFDLVRKDKRWYIKYKDVVQLLDKKEFEKFFVTTLNQELSITTNKKNNILYDGDEFYFKVKSSKGGYVSILTVYEDGTVSTLMKNIPLEKNSMINIPDKEFEAIPQAGLLEVGKDTFDMYVTIFSERKLIFDRFATADDEVIDDERYKNFDELIEFLKDKKYTTLKVITKIR